MVESSNTADTATFPDHTEGSHASNGVYNTYDDEFTLPKYINHYPPINEVISKFYVMEEMKKNWNGGDLYKNIFHVYDLGYAMRDLEASISRNIIVEKNLIGQLGDEK